MTIKSLAEELEIIDQTMVELDDRRTAIINQMANSSEPHNLPSNVIPFPARVAVKRPLDSSAAGWTPGSDFDDASDLE